MRHLFATWRIAPGTQFPHGQPLVEQFRISGLGGHDDLGFASGSDALDFAAISDRTDDWVGVIDGGAGDDILRGTNGRDRLDGGFGSDVLYGFAGDDQLWGDGGPGQGLTTNHDVLYGGQGNDDLLGGQGTNVLSAWSRAPQPAGDPQFGVYVDAAGVMYDDSGDFTGSFDAAGNALPDGLIDGTNLPARTLEDTGLNRSLGGAVFDQLYGGTGLDFLYGTDNTDPARADELYNRRGELFVSADGGLAGDEWKAYAQATNKVWYYGGTNKNDQINVDFVTEPGSVFSGHHLITRLTENNGAFSFDAQVQLDFNAVDGSGRRIWNPVDTYFGAALTGSAPAPENGQLSADAVFSVQLDDNLPIAVTLARTAAISELPRPIRLRSMNCTSPRTSRPNWD